VLDRGMDFVIGATPIPEYAEPAPSQENKDKPWPELAEARLLGVTSIRQRLAPDRTPVITAAVPVADGYVLHTTRNAVDITQRVRDARQTLALIVGAALLTSILLSLFLARTIVQPLRELVRAAVRVRSGRDREVVVPRLPDRGDEIGLLARTVSDMTGALRQRIDGVETFAADVAHELKNPLASLRSALESMDKVEDPALRGQLSAIAAHDVQRIDRLVTEIADASRIDAELSRTVFEPVDTARLIAAMTDARRRSGVDGDCEVSVSLKGKGKWLVSGDAPQLQRVIDNLLDNAVSFSPPHGGIEVEIRRESGRIIVSVCDHGPGIPPEVRERVFERFHSLRPASEDFGTHSGLGLAIARTIAEAHDGTLEVRDRPDGESGACLILSLPVMRGT
jgi:two-component system sensor histidine kinase ChvG